MTKPIQLLAAWLIGLIAVNTSFLGAAGFIDKPSWAAGLLVISAIANVPLFLFCLFFLQTRFRPEMQEDSYYAKYLERKSVETQKIEYVPIEPLEVSAPAPIGKKRVKHKESQEAVVAVNDLLPVFEDVVSKLKKAGIAIDKTFGSTNKEIIKPEKFIVTIGCDINIGKMQRVVKALADMKIDGFCLATEWHPKDIYVGAYNYRCGSAPIKGKHPALESLLSDELTSDKLVALLS